MRNRNGIFFAISSYTVDITFVVEDIAHFATTYLAYKSIEIANHIRWTWEPSEPRVGHRLAGADWLVGRDMRHVQGFWVLNGGEGGYAVLHGRENQAPSISLVLPKDVRADEQFMLVPELVETSPENVLFLLGQNGTIKALRS